MTVARFSQPDFTTAPDATTYKGSIDASIAVVARLAGAFAPHSLDTPDMKVLVDPGTLFDGTTVTEKGARTTGSTTNGSTSVTVASATGIANGMYVSGLGIPNNTTITISGTTVTLSQAATATASNAALTFMQVTGTITAPSVNPRIDRIVVDGTSGAVSVITGSESATPSAPAITSGKNPVAQVRLQPSTTAITNAIIADERGLVATPGVPVGAILMWSGTIASIPINFQLCDGTNGTPDLRNRFIVGANADVSGVAKSTITGSAAITGGATSVSTSSDGAHTHSGSTGSYTLTTTDIPSHTHAAGTLSASSDGTHTHQLPLDNGGTTGAPRGNTSGPMGSSFNTGSSGSHTHTVSGNTSSAGSGGGHSHSIGSDGGHTHSVSIIPSFYALAFIQRIS